MSADSLDPRRAPVNAGFAARLDLALKALSIGRGRLAQEIGVDKSLVSRWLSGAMRPAGHNLERITRLIAAHSPGFTMLDWDAPIDAFAARFGVGPPVVAPSLAAVRDLTAAAPATATAPAARAHSVAEAQALLGMHAMPFGLVEAAEKETARRARTYAARWQMTRLSASGRLVHVVERVLIRPEGDGLWIEHFAGGHRLCGWLLILGNRLYAMAADEADDSFGFYLLNGVVGPRADRLDGILTSVGSDRNADPFALVIVLERAGDLTHDAADIAWGEEALATGRVEASTIAPDIAAAVARDFGPSTLASGGDCILRIPYDRSLARGTLQTVAAGGG